MRERPILFSGAMVRAILSGRKTQTRRMVRNPEKYSRIAECGFCCPHGVAGDRLWVRETWCSYATMTREERAKSSAIYDKFIAGGYRNIVHAANDLPKPTGGPEYLYAADFDDETREDLKPWRPSIFMPRAASRFLLEITDVRVQRLQEISEEDALAEGITELPLQVSEPGAWWCADPLGNSELHCRTPRAAFCRLWDSINAERAPWSSNPWVWAITFRRVEQ